MTRVPWRKLRKLMNPWEREFCRSPKKFRSFWCWVCSEELQDCHAMHQIMTSCGELLPTGEEGHCAVHITVTGGLPSVAIFIFKPKHKLTYSRSRLPL